MIRQVSAPDRGPALVKQGAQFLNPIDRTIRCIDRVARQLGYPGIETQMLVWLAGRADAAALARAIARLGRHYPVMASRFVEDDGAGRPHWQFRRGEVCPLAQATLRSDDPEAVLEYAGELLSTARDPAAADPLRFHLLHRPGGADVFLLQYNHVLMDNRAAVPLLREIERLSRSPTGRGWQSEPRDLVSEHLRQFSRPKRRKAIEAAIELQARVFRGRAATLLPAAPPPPGRARLRIVSHRLEATPASALRAKVVALCGFPCVSMAVLGSAFRAIGRLGPPDGSRHHFATGIGIPIGRSGQTPPLFQNVTSALSIGVARQDLGDRNSLVRILSEQLRERIADGIDLGVLGATAMFARRYRYVEWVAWHLVRYAYSLWYGYFGRLDDAGETLGGSPIEEVFFSGGPLWPSIGLALLASQHRGRLNLQATYDERLVSPRLAEAFLDFVLADLAGM
jgi:hypothetical protein